MTEPAANIQMAYDSSFRGRGRYTRIIIAGGGTGGHIFPAIAIANAIKQIQPDSQILFIGAKNKMEMEKVPQAGYKIEGIDIAGFNRSSLIKNIALPLKLIKSFWQVRKIISDFKPDAVVGVGGYSSYPVLKYSQHKGIPTFIHESNSLAGKTNILIGKNATKIFVATDGMEKFFPREKIQITGNPVRKSIADSTVTRSQASRFFNLDENKITVLAVGGSLGARSINEALSKNLDAFKLHDLQLIWQTGKTNSADYKEKGKSFLHVSIHEFISQMQMAYAAADIVISRSGAMAVTELSVAAKPSIFVPFPYAAEDHQTVNAQKLADKKAALMIADNEADKKLAEVTISLAQNKSLQQQLSQNIAKFAITNADEVIAREILRPRP